MKIAFSVLLRTNSSGSEEGCWQYFFHVLPGPESLLFIIYVTIPGRRGLAAGILFNMLFMKTW